MADGPPEHVDIVIVGAGAAGLAAAIFARRTNPHRSVCVLEGARRPGAKILVSGGTRCNVTNRIVTEHDFWGGSPVFIRRVLRTFPADAAIRFFQDLGVPLHEEAGGKLFPDGGRARDVLNALLEGVRKSGASLVAACRVTSIERSSEAFRLLTSTGEIDASVVVLATGGKSLPKSGSDGAGLEFARRLGHTIVPTTPALVPLLLDDSTEATHRTLAGVSHPAELALWLDGRIATRLTGSLLWTHFGISGPVALDASRHWLRAALDGRDAKLTLSFFPDETFDAIERRWLAAARERPTQSVLNTLAGWVPTSVAALVLEQAEVDGGGQMAHLSRDERKRIGHALVEWPLAVVGSRGYNFAEATAGGVALEEISTTTMESRVCPGLFLIGEMLDVDGRIGGFNFQWAWSSAFVAGRAVSLES